MEQSLSRTARWILAVAMIAITLAVAGIRGPSDATSSIAQAAEPKGEKSDPSSPQQNQAQGLVIAGPNAPSGQQQSVTGTITINGQTGTFTVNGAGTLTLQGGGTVMITGVTNVSSLRSAEYIPENAKIVVVVSPSELMKFPSAAQLLPLFGKSKFEKLIGFPIVELQDVELISIDPLGKFNRVVGGVIAGGRLRPEPQFDRVVLRASKPQDWKQTLSKDFPALKLAKANDAEYFVMDSANLSRTGDVGPCFYVPDDRTLIAGTEEEIQNIIRDRGKLRDFPFAIPAIRDSQIAVWIDTSIVQQLSKGIDHQVALLLGPVISSTKNALLSANLSQEAGVEKAAIQLAIECNSDDAAKGVTATLEAAKTLLKNAISVEQELLKTDHITPADAFKLAQLKSDLVQQVGRIVESTSIHAEEKRVAAESKFELPPTLFTSLIKPALEASREAAMRAVDEQSEATRAGIA